MRDIAALTFVTLDGVMQAPSQPEEDKSYGFEDGGWAAPYWNDVMDHVQREAMEEPYDMLFGRKTYDLFAGHWPNQTQDPAARAMNEARKYVVTSRTTDLAWSNSKAISGDVFREIAQLKAQEGPLLQIHGSWALIQSLLSKDLIDEFRIWTFPVVAGAGKRLFGSNAPRRTLKLKKTEASPGGPVMSIYRRT